MRNWFRNRYLDILGSIYIYNEHRGYTAVDDLLQAVRWRWPDERALIARIEKHRADERKHYVMFRRWFERRGIMPYALDAAFGHIDRFVAIMFGQGIDDLDKRRVVARRPAVRQVVPGHLADRKARPSPGRDPAAPSAGPVTDRSLTRMFKIIERDEPSHWEPYDEWLAAHGVRNARWWERAVDNFIHSELLFLKLPYPVRPSRG